LTDRPPATGTGDVLVAVAVVDRLVEDLVTGGVEMVAGMVVDSMTEKGDVSVAVAVAVAAHLAGDLVTGGVEMVAEMVVDSTEMTEAEMTEAVGALEEEEDLEDERKEEGGLEVVDVSVAVIEGIEVAIATAVETERKEVGEEGQGLAFSFSGAHCLCRKRRSLPR